MIAELAFDRSLGVAADRSGECGIGKFLNHLLFGEISQGTALSCAAFVGGVFLCQGSEICTIVQLFNNILSFVLGFD